VKNIWLSVVLAAGCAGQTRLHLETQARRAPAISLLADFTVTTAGSTVSVTGGKARIGNTVYTLVGGSCTLSGAVGDVKVYISDTGNLMCVGEPGMAGTVSGSAVFATVTFPRYPVGSIPLSDLTWTGSTLTVDSDDRAFISNIGTSAGLGISVLEAGGVANVNIDTATVPLLAGANNWLGHNDFSAATRTAPHRVVSADPATCTVGDSIFNTASSQVKYCVSTNTWVAASAGTGGGSGFDRQFTAAKCQNTVAGAAFSLPTANAPVAVCQTGTNTTDYATLDWDDVPTKSAYDFVLLPTGTLPTIRVDAGWSTSATSGTVNWRIAVACVSANPDPAFGADQTISATAAAVANQITRSTLSALTLTGCSAGQQMRFRIQRDTTDTVTATARLHYLRFYQ
jgi:hypothetical protein